MFTIWWLYSELNIYSLFKVVGSKTKIIYWKALNCSAEFRWTREEVHIFSCGSVTANNIFSPLQFVTWCVPQNWWSQKRILKQREAGCRYRVIYLEQVRWWEAGEKLRLESWSAIWAGEKCKAPEKRGNPKEVLQEWGSELNAEGKLWNKWWLSRCNQSNGSTAISLTLVVTMIFERRQ